jgi:hypothetical protein
MFPRLPTDSAETNSPEAELEEANEELFPDVALAAPVDPTLSLVGHREC